VRPSRIAFAVLVLLCGCNRQSERISSRFPAVASQLSGPAFLRSGEGFVSPAGQMKVTLPKSGHLAVRLMPRAEAEVHVFEEGLSGLARADEDSLSYARPDGRSHFFLTATGFEEWVELEHASSEAVASWTLSGAVLQLNEDGAVWVLVKNEPVLRVTAPFAVDRQGNRFRAWLTVSGQRLSLFTEARGHVLVDPSWTTVAGSLARFQHTATLLPNGRVMLVGGRTVTGAGALQSQVEIREPVTGGWSMGPPTTFTRYFHTATLLRSGRVLIVGGDTSTTVTASPSNRLELYDPVTNAWTLVTATLATARFRHTATQLADGRVLIVGGLGPSDTPVTFVEVYTENVANPATSTVTTASPMGSARDRHTATLLPNGDVLVAGGGATDVGETWSPATGVWTPTGSLGTNRFSHTSNVLIDGGVIVIGGNNPANGAAIATTEFYNATTRLFSAGPSTAARASHTSTMLPDGTLLVAGGAASTCSVSSTCVQISVDGGFSPLSGTNRSFHAATLLPSGKVLITGGVVASSVVGTADLVSHRTPVWSAGPPLQIARTGHTATTLANGDVLVAGGSTASAERLFLGAGAWVSTPPMSVARSLHTATLLNDGRVLVTGGSTAELYDPESGAWGPAASLAPSRNTQSAMVLASGRVLVVSLVAGNNAVSDVYDPATNTWAQTTGLPAVARSKPTLSLLNDGRVLMTGGVTVAPSDTAATEVFTPSTGLWTTASPMANTRGEHTATTLPNGSVLVIGGQSDGGTRSELFDGANWSGTALNQVARRAHAATLLRDGTVLVVGGVGSPVQSEVFELSSTAGSGQGIFSLQGLQQQGATNVRLARLPEGDVLAIGGANPGATSWVERFVWQPDAPALRPVLTGVPTLVSPNTSFTITGSNFLGLLDASGGNTTSSSSNRPIIEVEQLATGNRRSGSLGAVSQTSLVVDGGFPAGLYWLRVINSGASSSVAVLPVFPPLTISPTMTTVPPRGQVAFVGSGSAGSGYGWTVAPNPSGGTIDGGLYVAGAIASVTDTVVVRDRFGNSAPAQVSVGVGVSILPGSASTPPRGALAFTAAGGSNTSFAWNMAASPSGGSVSNGAYLAGPTGSVTDVVRVTDSLGNVATRNVTVSAGVSISPANPTVVPRNPQTFSAMGGSNTGFTWALITNLSGATFDGGAAGYIAGPTPSVVDTLRVTDSLGNTATTLIAIGPALSISPMTTAVAPRQARTFVAANGVAPFTWTPFVTSSGGSMTGLPDGGGAYVAGPMGLMTDSIQVTDAVGNSATASVNVGPGVSLSPPSATLPPRAQLLFAAAGGSDAGFVWSMASSSGGGVDGGLYRATATGNLTEALRVTDSLGNFATAAITITGGVTVSPGTVTVAPGGTAIFSASGGSDAGFTWSLSTNASDGGIGALTGVYRAGALGSRLDVVRATDSLGNFATGTVTISPGVSITPPTAATPPLGTISFSAMGGSGAPFTWTLSSNPSGGTVTATGQYMAGPMEAVDTLRVTDGNGNVATAQITVTNALTVTPSVITLPPRESLVFNATGGSMTGFVWTLVTNNSGASLDGGTGFYVAGATGSVTDSIRVTDSLGATATATITVGPGVTVAPASVTVTPRGTLRFNATGGRSATFTWALSTNASGGTINAAGDYVAGPNGNTSDVVQATDTLGNVGIATVAVSAGVSISPPAINLPPRSSMTFSAAGGTNLGFTWSLVARPSGGSIDPFTGQYVAGSTAAVTDVVQARDSLGNLATASVQVSDGVIVMPANPAVGPRGAIAFTATGGADGGYRWAVRTNLSGATIDLASGQYTAGTTGNVIDVVEATDALGNQGTANVQVFGSVSVVPMQANQAPRSTRVFQVVGGTAPFSWSLSTNGSGARVDGGVYTAGSTGGVTDVVAVTDSAGNTASATVQLTSGVTVTPPTASVGLQGSQTFSAAGGSGEGYTWRIRTNASQGFIDEQGAYTAGATSGSDVIEAIDSLGNTGTATVLVVAGAGVGTMTPFNQRPPISGWSCGCNTGGADASLLLGVVLVLVRRRLRKATCPRRRVSWLSLCCFVALSATAALAKKSKPQPIQKAPPPAALNPPLSAPTEPAPAPAPVPVPPPPRRSEKPSLAVLDVEVTVLNEKLDGAAFSEMLVSAADGPAMFRVISSKDIATMLGFERQRQLSGCNEDSSCMTEIANALGADFVMVATVGKVAENYLVSTRLFDGQTSRAVGRGSVQATDANLLLSAVWTATAQALDAWGAGLSGDEAARWANRARPALPAAMVSSKPLVSSFGATIGAVGGYQVLSIPGQRGSVGVQVDGTWRLGRFDVALGLVIGPNLGARLTATWALIAARFRLMAGLRGSGYPGLVVYGGGPVVSAEFAFTPWLAASATGGGDFFPATSGLVVVLLGSAGVAMHF
jgi:hypothetical protein